MITVSKADANRISQPLALKVASHLEHRSVLDELSPEPEAEGDSTKYSCIGELNLERTN